MPDKKPLTMTVFGPHEPDLQGFNNALQTGLTDLFKPAADSHTPGDIMLWYGKIPDPHIIKQPKSAVVIAGVRLNKEQQSELHEAAIKSDRPFLYCPYPIPGLDDIMIMLKHWLQYNQSSAPYHWHLYEAFGRESLVPSIKPLIASIIINAHSDTEQDPPRVHDKPYGPKEGLGDGDITHNQEQFGRLIYDMSLTRLAPWGKQSLNLTVSDPINIINYLGMMIQKALAEPVPRSAGLQAIGIA